MVANFHELHERLYTYNLPHQTVELVNLRVTALGSLPRPTSEPVTVLTESSPVPTYTREARLSRREGYVEVPVYQRDQMAPGVRIEGPAIVEQRDTTTLLAAGYASTSDGYGNLIIRPRRN